MGDFVEHLVIGSGFSGLAIAHALQKDGATDIRIVDRAAEPGGVWLVNNYPGCSCDVPSYLYALDELPQYNWTRRYPAREEILDYIQKSFTLTGLDRHFVPNTEITDLEWLDHEACWQVRCTSSPSFKARFVYAGTGQMPQPTVPPFRGLESFNGTWFHSSQWPSDLDLANKRIAVVGTGASGVQLLAETAKLAKHVTVFQRNGPYLVPRRDREFHRWERGLLGRSRFFRKLYRSYLYWKHELNGIAYFNVRPLLQVVRFGTRRHIAKYLRKEEAIRGALPTYAPGCKRILVNDDYYPTLAQDNVDLVTAGIDHIDAEGPVCSDGSRHQADVLVMATGFDGTRPMPGINVLGRNGKNLHQHWDQAGVRAFYGTQVNGFPNLFLLIGPNVGLAHNSVLYMMESQVEFACRIVQWAVTTNKTAEVREDVQIQFNQRLDERLEKTPWQTGGCVSWYHDQEKRNVGLWPTYTFLFRSELQSATPDTQVHGVVAAE